jgi:hypothetical protein
LHIYILLRLVITSIINGKTFTLVLKIMQVSMYFKNQNPWYLGVSLDLCTCHACIFSLISLTIIYYRPHRSFNHLVDKVSSHIGLLTSIGDAELAIFSSKLLAPDYQSMYACSFLKRMSACSCKPLFALLILLLF